MRTDLSKFAQQIANAPFLPLSVDINTTKQNLSVWSWNKYSHLVDFVSTERFLFHTQVYSDQDVPKEFKANLNRRLMT